MVRVRGVATRDLVLGVVALVLVVVAVVLFMRSGRDAVPTDKFVSFYCPQCKQSFQVSERDFEKLWDKGEYRSAGGKAALLFKCQKCGQMTAQRAADSPADIAPGAPSGEPPQPSGS